MRSSPLRSALCLTVLLAAAPFSRLFAAETPAPVVAPEDTPAAPAPTPAAAPTPAPAATPAPYQDSAEAKLAVVLRSYTLLQEENDQLKTTAEKNTTEISALAAQLAVAKDALPLAAQAAGLREQLRQTQDQLGALALENNALKTRLAVNPAAPGTSNLTPVSVPTTLTPITAPAAPISAPRVHVVAGGETLSKISVQYYGSASRWPDILAANKDVLKNEKSLLVGTKLKIP